MKEGDKIVCVNPPKWSIVCAGPSHSDIVTIRGFGNHPYSGALCISLCEFNPNFFYNIKHFRPIDYSFGEKIAEELEKEFTKLSEPVVSFELTMPGVNSWNGKWSGADKKYYVVQSISNKWLEKQEYFKQLLDKGKDSFYYSFGDGWAANVYVEIVDSTEARKRRKISAGFCGYEWMIDSIKHHGRIQVRTQPSTV